MAVFRATFSQVQNQAMASNTPMPVLHLPSAERLTTLLTSGSSQIVQLSGADWQAPADGYVLVHSDGDVDVAASESPVANATSGFFLPADTLLSFSIAEGDKIAVVNA